MAQVQELTNRQAISRWWQIEKPNKTSFNRVHCRREPITVKVEASF